MKKKSQIKSTILYVNDTVETSVRWNCWQNRCLSEQNTNENKNRLRFASPLFTLGRISSNFEKPVQPSAGFCELCPLCVHVLWYHFQHKAFIAPHVKMWFCIYFDSSSWQNVQKSILCWYYFYKTHVFVTHLLIGCLYHNSCIQLKQSICKRENLAKAAMCEEEGSWILTLSWRRGTKTNWS